MESTGRKGMKEWGKNELPGKWRGQQAGGMALNLGLPSFSSQGLCIVCSMRLYQGPRHASEAHYWTSVNSGGGGVKENTAGTITFS